MNKIKGLHFQPWVGENYGKCQYGKILLLGESHYLNEDEDSVNLTKMVVKNAIDEHDGMNTSFFRTTELIFNRKDYQTFWNDVAYANLIQKAMEKTKSQPEPDDIATISPSFKLLLDNLKPEKVLILSKRMWEYWLTSDNSYKVKDIKRNGKNIEIWKYSYEGGNCLATGIWHPSRIWGNAYKDWASLVNTFLLTELDKE